MYRILRHLHAERADEWGCVCHSHLGWENDCNQGAPVVVSSDVPPGNAIAIPVEPEPSGIEPCDLLETDGKFIHVKRKTRSSTLSHLFLQGATAAETFLRDEHFRKRLHELVKQDNQVAAQRLEAMLLGEPEPSRHEVVFGIITPSNPGDWPGSLPFFSQLSLVRVTERLKMFGYKTSLHRIGISKKIT